MLRSSWPELNQRWIGLDRARANCERIGPGDESNPPRVLDQLTIYKIIPVKLVLQNVMMTGRKAMLPSLEMENAAIIWNMTCSSLCSCTR